MHTRRVRANKGHCAWHCTRCGTADIRRIWDAGRVVAVEAPTRSMHLVHGGRCRTECGAKMPAGRTSEIAAAHLATSTATATCAGAGAAGQMRGCAAVLVEFVPLPAACWTCIVLAGPLSLLCPPPPPPPPVGERVAQRHRQRAVHSGRDTLPRRLQQQHPVAGPTWQLRHSLVHAVG